MMRRGMLGMIVIASLWGAVAMGKPSDLDRARKATARYHSLKVAKDHGYKILRDAAGIACIDQPGEGGMGIHYVKDAFVGDGEIDAGRPEALVYDPGKHGKRKLVAVEYVVLQDAWDANHEAPPALFGQEFELVPEGNRYGLPPFYELHAWLWKHNPSGLHADWNPKVVC